MPTEDWTRRLRIEATSTGMEKLAGDLDKVAGMAAKSGKSMEDLVVVSGRSERAVISQENAFARLERRYVDGVRQQQELAKVQQNVNAAVAQNPALQERANAVLAGASQRLNQVHSANQNVAQSTGLARYEMINLGRQGADVFTQLASGQSLFLIAAQQGPQVLDIFATSQGRFVDTLKSGVGWLGRFATSAAGVATGVIGIGAAAIFAATQFARASTTIEQALEEQNRLLKEGKALLDARTSAEARAQLQSKEQTQFETLRNQLDLQIKLNQAMEEASAISRRRATRPTEVPGEMGVAPTGFAALPDAGLDKMTAAFVALKEAQAAGLPGIKQYNAELAKIGLAHPELALVVQDMIKAGEAGLQLEFAAQRAKAMSDALRGIATDAQMAAVGLNSVAQFKLNNLQANEGRESAERQAAATLMIRDAWGGVSIEAAKSLDSLSRQLALAQAVGQMAQIEAQHRAKVAELSQRMSVSEATRIADYERAVSLAQIEAGHKQQMVALQGQLSVAEQVTGIGQINAQYEATVASLSLQIGQVKAIEQAEMQRAISIAQVNANADQTLNSLRQQNELIRAGSDQEEDRIRAQQTYQNLIDQGVDKSKAAAVASQQQSNAEEAREKRHQAAAEKAIASIKTRTDAWKAHNTEFENTGRALITWSQANDAAGDILRRMEQGAEDAAHAMNRFASSMWNATQQALLANTAFVPFATTWASMGPSGLGTGGAFQGKQGLSQFDPQGYGSTTQTPQLQFASNVYGAGGFDSKTMQPNQQGLTNLVNSYLSGGRTIATAGWESGGGVMGAIEGLLSGAGGSGGVRFGSGGLDGQTLALVQQLTGLLPDDQKAGVIERELSLLRAQPQNIETMQAMAQLTQSLIQLRGATDANTDALKITTDPLISQGHDYLNNLKIGYYRAASGFDGVARGGTPGVDSIPFHAMVQDGERITITPRGGSGSTVSNDNSRSVVQHITQNISLAGGGADRRTAKQMAQGFIAGAAQAVG